MVNAESEPRLYVRVATHSGWSNYRAWGNGIEFRGSTAGYTKDVEDILRRMVRARAEPPEAVVKTARLLFDHIKALLEHADIIDHDSISTAVEVKNPEAPYTDFTLYMEVEIKQVDVMDLIATCGGEDLGPEVPGWVVAITATYVGYDGLDGEGRHTVKRVLAFKGRIDPDMVWNELMTTIKRAVNALPTE
jgi:hypothetical protein